MADFEAINSILHARRNT